MRENENKQGDKGHVIWGRYCKSYKIHRRRYGHVERMQFVFTKNAKKNATAAIEGVRKRDQKRKGWRDEVEEYLNIMGTENRQAVVTDRREWKKIVLEDKVQNGE
jgi:hypothetical protein